MQDVTELLCCPVSGSPFRLFSLSEATDVLSDPRMRPPTFGDGRPVIDVERTPSWLITEDRSRAYPVVDGVPWLLPWTALAIDPIPVCDFIPPGSNVMGESAYYDGVGQAALDGAEFVDLVLRLRALDGATEHIEWVERALETRFDREAERVVYEWAREVESGTTLQIGGWGSMALAFALGDEASILLTPSHGEARFAGCVSSQLEHRPEFLAVVGLAESMPFKSESFDRVVSGGSIHHTNVRSAGAEIRRICTVGGRFASFEPWPARGRHLGLRLFGKRDPHVACRPFDIGSLEILIEELNGVHPTFHGAYARYALLAASKLGLEVSPGLARAASDFGTRIARFLGLAHRDSSSVALTWEKLRTC